MNKKQKSLTNKGFSLVELIIVIAIMAVLVGAFAPQYVKYLDKSRYASDVQVADSLRQAIEITYMDPMIPNPSNLKKATADTDAVTIPDLSTLTAGSDEQKFWKEVYDVMGATAYANIKSTLKLDPSTTAVALKYYINGDNVVVIVDGGDYTGNYAINIK